MPFGLIEAETANPITTWSVTSNALYRGGSGLQVTTSGAGTATAQWSIDPSVLTADEFMPGEVQVEVWGRVLLQDTLVSPRAILSLAGAGASAYAAEFGATGRLLGIPTTSNCMRFVKFGTMGLPVDMGQPAPWGLGIGLSWAAGSSGPIGLDYIVCVPARSRALGPTGKPNDESYPKFIPTTSATTKTIRADLSGRIALGSGNPGRDCGLGGALLELAPGNADVFVKLASLVPDDPTVDATTEQISHTGVSGTLRVTPRVWLAG